MKLKVTITLDDRNWQRLRMQALEDKTSASAIIDKLVADYLPKETRRFVVGKAYPTAPSKVRKEGGKR